jgi:hypothetical protein
MLVATAAVSHVTFVEARKGRHGHGPALEFLGQATLPAGLLFNGTVVGGLSSITYDARRDVFHALSDDQSVLSPARFYTLAVNVADGHLEDGDIQLLDVTTLLAPDGQPYPPASFDPEGLTLSRKGELIVTSEGIANSGIAPWVRRYAIDGHFLADLPVPGYYPPTATRGVRQNLAFEAAAVTPHGNHLLVGMEGALLQDGPPATLTNGSASRILRYNLSSRRLEKEFVYVTDPIAESPVPATAFAVSGLVEILPLNPELAITMERSFSVGAPGLGNTIRLYLAGFHGARDVLGVASLNDVRKLRPVDKTLLLDLDSLGIPLDNIEGMTFGPDLPDGRRSLILVSDNNFTPGQYTQFLMFAFE